MNVTHYNTCEGSERTQGQCAHDDSLAPNRQNVVE